MALASKAYLAKIDYEITVNGEPTGVVWTLHSTSCEAAQKIEREMQEDAMTGSLLADVADGGTDAIKEGLIKSRLANIERLYAACVSGWNWNGEEFLEGEGSPEFSYENVLSILMHPGGVDIKNQIIAAVEGLGNGSKKSTKNL